MYVESSSPNYPFKGPFLLETTIDERMNKVDFYYHMYGGSMGTLTVDTFDGKTWISYWNMTGNENTWKFASVGFSRGGKIFCFAHHTYEIIFFH